MDDKSGLLRLAQHHYIHEQTARHHRIWSDHPPATNFTDEWLLITPAQREGYIDRVKYLDVALVAVGRVLSDRNEYEVLVKAVYQQCFEGVMPELAVRADGVSIEGFKDAVRRVTASIVNAEALGGQGLETQAVAVGGLGPAIGQAGSSAYDAGENSYQTAGDAGPSEQSDVHERVGSGNLGAEGNTSGLGDVGPEHDVDVFGDVGRKTGGAERDTGVGNIGQDTGNAGFRRSASPENAMMDEVVSLASSLEDISMSTSPVLNRFPESTFSAKAMRCAENKRLDEMETTVEAGLEKLHELKRLFESSTAWNGETDWLAEIDKTFELAKQPKVVIGVVGATGAGKSSIINAIADEENILATNCMRASTAVATEVSYNDGPHRYKAHIEFINRGEWETELNVLFKDLLDKREDVMRNCVPKDSEAAAAVEKIRALYPGVQLKDVLYTSVESLLNYEPVTQLLGTSVVIEEDNPKVFSQKMVSYLDSKGKRNRESSPMGELEQNHGLWPLIRVVRVYVKSEALSTGAILVDLPGVADSNAARVAVAEEYTKRCSAHWIVAPINRAVDDKVARDLLTKNFKRQLQMDCAYNDISFVCTKTDDISVSEVQDSLGVQIPPAEERIARDKKIKSLASELKQLIKKRNSVSLKQSKVDDKIEVLDSQEDTDSQASPQVTPQKRKSLSDDHVPETSKSPTSSGSPNVPMTTPQRAHKRKVSLLKSQRKDLRTQQRSLDDQIRAKEQELTSLKTEAETAERKILQDCVRARNEYSKQEIKREFVRSIWTADQKRDVNELDEAPQDYNKMERNLPVFCVSAKAYQQLCGRLRRDSRAVDFGDVENTEIPVLQGHCIAVTERAREATARRFLLQLVQLFQSITIWASASQPEKNLARQQEIEIGFNQSVAKFNVAATRILGAACLQADATYKRYIFDQLNHAARLGSDQSCNAIMGWSQYFWSTYRATCNRNGTFKMLKWNQELADPMIDHLLPKWNETFSIKIPRHLRVFSVNIQRCIKSFNLMMTLFVQGISPDHQEKLNALLTTYGGNFDHQVRHFEQFVKNGQRDVNRCFANAICDHLRPVYDTCAQQRGAGTYTRMRDIMLREFDENRDAIFMRSTNNARVRLEQLQQATRDSLHGFVNDMVRGLSRDYRAVILAPYLKRLTAEQVQIRNDVAKFIEEADSQLHLEDVVERQIHQASVPSDDAENARDISPDAVGEQPYIKPEENIGNMFDDVLADGEMR